VVWWIAGGVAAGSLLLLGLAVASLRGRVLEFARVAALAARRLTAQADRLQAGADRLQVQVAGVERRAVAAQEQSALSRAKRGG
jgi:hypothetical protein